MLFHSDGARPFVVALNSSRRSLDVTSSQTVCRGHKTK